METDPNNVTIRKLRQDEESQARDIIVSGIYTQLVTVLGAIRLLIVATLLRCCFSCFWRMYVAYGFLMAIFYAVSNSVWVSVILTAVSCLPAAYGIQYTIYLHWLRARRMELDHLYSWYNAKSYKTGRKFWVAVCDGKVIGTAAVEKTSNTEAELKWMSVLPEYRRRGVGTRLMKRFEGYCRCEGVEKMVIGTSRLQPEAVRLFKRSGFVCTLTVAGGIFRFEKMI
ncbi:Hypp2454 [Branchiostoma lanceolatum]|uniref:Hypp2454 protein n=1 Tax=Branchiostoma lanceolatum TaxID=7740 RepID=A0A8J9ZTB2_BRALA|nr:Hypp2454 [Branchiostoma lanceolatum]